MVERVQKGKPRAFTELYQSYYPELCSYISSRSGLEASRVEDIAQEVFIQVYKKLDQLKKPENFTVWMYQIANRALLNNLRSDQRHNLPTSGDFDRDGLTVADASPLPEDLVVDRERNALVRDCMEKLSEPQRSVLNLYYGAGLDAPEIAQIRNNTAGTVRNQLMAARRNLKELLEQERQGELLRGTAVIPGAVVATTGKPGLMKRLIARITTGFSNSGSSGAGGASASTGLSATAKVAMGAATLAMALGAGGVSLAPADQPTPPVSRPQSVSKVVPLESCPVTAADQKPVATAQQTPVATDPQVAAAPVVEAPAAPTTPQPAAPAPAPAPAPRPDPVITLAQSHIYTTVGVALSPQQILMKAGAQATDADGALIPVELVGYDSGVFRAAGTYAMTVIARDSQGNKAWSRVVFVEVR
ncbi:MAG: sigma-70 family RNA polymerase sigma factor [Actinomycetia bacterium]|nr:sigma-70 family RNA polymerase sigma factor [Actinomycetes bacterium]